MSLITSDHISVMIEYTVLCHRYDVCTMRGFQFKEFLCNGSLEVLVLHLNTKRFDCVGVRLYLLCLQYENMLPKLSQQAGAALGTSKLCKAYCNILLDVHAFIAPEK